MDAEWGGGAGTRMTHEAQHRIHALEKENALVLRELHELQEAFEQFLLVSEEGDSLRSVSCLGLDALHNQLAEIEASASWRLTAPLRFVANGFKWSRAEPSPRGGSEVERIAEIETRINAIFQSRSWRLTWLLRALTALLRRRTWVEPVSVPPAIMATRVNGLLNQLHEVQAAYRRAEQKNLMLQRQLKAAESGHLERERALREQIRQLNGQ